MNKRFGFTLAEVLITLGIIGVVAAMTIPNLIANTNSAKFRSQFKKSISTLSQAGLMAQAQYDFDYSGAAVCSSGASDNPTSDQTFCSLINGTLTGATYYASVEGIKRNENGTAKDYGFNNPEGFSANVATTDMHAYSLADGSIVAFPSAAANCTLPLGTTLDAAIADDGTLAGCIGFIDVNGPTLPNKEVTCSDGTASKTTATACIVKNDAAHMTDVFPVVFHDATVEPATNAAKYVLTSSK